MSEEPSAESALPLRRAAGVGLAAATAALLVLSLGNAIDAVLLVRGFWGRSLPERARLAADEWANPYARSGRLRIQEAFAEISRSEGRPPSHIAYALAWTLHSEARLPRNARVYLAARSAALYGLATSLWYPRRIEFGCDAMVDDLENLPACPPIDSAEATRRGYTHAITFDPERGYQLHTLAAAGSAP